MPGSALAERAPLQPNGQAPEGALDQPDLSQVPVGDIPVVSAEGMEPSVTSAQQPGNEEYDAASFTDESSVDQTGEQFDPVDARVHLLRNAVDELAGDSSNLSEATRTYVREGGGIQTALAEIDELRGKKPEGPEQELQTARQEYVTALASKDKEVRRTAQEQYKSAVIKAFREATVRENASPEHTEKTTITPESLAEQRLSIVTDLVLSERHRLQATLQESGPKPRVIESLLEKNKVRMTMVSGLVGTALATRFGLLPSEASTHMVEHGLNMATAFLFAHNTQETVSKQIEGRRAARQAAKQAKALEEDQTKTGVTKRVIRRSRARPNNHEDVYAPEEAEQFVGGVVLGHMEDIQSAAEKPEKADETYAHLLASLVEDELAATREKVSMSRVKWVLFGGLSVAASMSMAGPMVAAAESAALGREAKEIIET